MVQNFGKVSEMDESVLLQVGCILQGFSTADLENISLSLDNVEEIAECGWNATQVKYKSSVMLMICILIIVILTTHLSQ